MKTKSLTSWQSERARNKLSFLVFGRDAMTAYKNAKKGDHGWRHAHVNRWFNECLKGKTENFFKHSDQISTEGKSSFKFIPAVTGQLSDKSSNTQAWHDESWIYSLAVVVEVTQTWRSSVRMWCLKNSNAGHNQTKSESFIWLFEQKVDENQKETAKPASTTGTRSKKN